MERRDLLLMSHDDIIAFSNRGTLKRLLKELERTDLKAEIEIGPEALEARWSDGVACRIGAGESLIQAHCTCDSQAEVCRHLLRTVLAYQRLATTEGAPGEAVAGEAKAGERAEPESDPTDSASVEQDLRRQAKDTAGDSLGNDSVGDDSERATFDDAASEQETIDQVACDRAPAAPPNRLVAEPPPEDPTVDPCSSSRAQYLPEPWDPGAWPDESINQHFPKGEQSRAKRLWNRGLVMELQRDRRPEARFHRLGHLVRFVLPGDPVAARCDCSESRPCIHLLLAIWGFRELPEGESWGIVAVGRAEAPLAESVSSQVERALKMLVEEGLSSLSPMVENRVLGAMQVLEDVGAIWPAQILQDLLNQAQAHRNRDARFSPLLVADLLGELQLRIELSVLKNPPLPRFFVMGHKLSGQSSLGTATLVGLGSVAHMQGNSVELLAMTQNSATGQFAAISRRFEPDESGQLASFDKLGASRHGKVPAVRALGASRLVVEHARVLPDLRLRLGRSPVGLYPTDHLWEHLRPPLLVESLAELGARLEHLPPASLRPRRLGENFFVCPIAAVVEVQFCVRTQATKAVVKDGDGTAALLFHPYTSRNASGTEALMHRLRQTEARPIFVAGQARKSPAGTVIEPSGVLFETQAGNRELVQPWLDPWPERATPTTQPQQGGTPTKGPLDQLIERHHQLVAELALLGQEQGRLRCTESLNCLLNEARQLGLSCYSCALDDLREHLLPNTSSEDFAHSFLNNARLARWAKDITVATN